LRIAARGHLPKRLVVQQSLGCRGLRHNVEIELAAVQPDISARLGSLAQLGAATLYGHPTCADPLFYLPARADAGTREQFLQSHGGRGCVHRIDTLQAAGWTRECPAS
jgi:hypothetical protein